MTRDPSKPYVHTAPSHQFIATRTWQPEFVTVMTEDALAPAPQSPGAIVVPGSQAASWILAAPRINNFAIQNSFSFIALPFCLGCQFNAIARIKLAF
jgi:hypothetical protein